MNYGGASFTPVSTPPSSSPGGLTLANNGTSQDPAGTVVLGQAVGAAGNPGALLSAREIPLSTFALSLLVSAGVSYTFSPTTNGLQFIDPAGTVGIRNSASNFQLGSGSFVAAFQFAPAQSNFMFSDNGAFASSANSYLVNLRSSAATRSVGLMVEHVGIAGIFSSQVRNNSAATGARTQFQATNDAGTGVAILGVGSAANSVYPNTAFLESGANTNHLNIHASGVAGFISFGTGNSGTPGEKMRLLFTGVFVIGGTAALGMVGEKLNVVGTIAQTGSNLRLNASAAVVSSLTLESRTFPVLVVDDGLVTAGRILVGRNAGSSGSSLGTLSTDLIAIGYQSFQTNGVAGSSENIGIGGGIAPQNNSGANNTIVGALAANNDNGGNLNAVFGNRAGQGIAAGNDSNTIIGSFAGTAADGVTGAIAATSILIGSGAGASGLGAIVGAQYNDCILIGNGNGVITDPGGISNTVIIGNNAKTDLSDFIIIGSAGQQTAIGFSNLAAPPTGSVLTVNGAISSSDPGNGVGQWKFGIEQTQAVVLDATRYMEVEVNGIIYKLAIVN